MGMGNAPCQSPFVCMDEGDSSDAVSGGLCWAHEQDLPDTWDVPDVDACILADTYVVQQ